MYIQFPFSKALPTDIMIVNPAKIVQDYLINWTLHLSGKSPNE